MECDRDDVNGPDRIQHWNSWIQCYPPNSDSVYHLQVAGYGQDDGKHAVEMGAEMVPKSRVHGGEVGVHQEVPEYTPELTTFCYRRS